ncbi:MAG: hypothetical protein KDD47_14035 [Acidobacteria bacterium]|nr:hypothetical protein [Acidobacteriota bacterium]
MDRLRRQAKASRRSLNQEALMRLERSLGLANRDVDETMASLRALHRKLEHLPPVEDDFIDRAKREGRL